MSYGTSALSKTLKDYSMNLKDLSSSGYNCLYLIMFQ